MLGCRVFGHRWRFSADGPVLRWECERGCGAARSKTYATAEQASRYARAFDKRDADDVGRRPLLSLAPLWLARRAGQSDGPSSAGGNSASSQDASRTGRRNGRP